MNKKKIIERYKQIRLLIMRAREDAALWGTNDNAKLLIGIKETSAHDFSVYDDVYNKLVQKRRKAMNATELEEAKRIETNKKNRSAYSSEGKPTRTEFELARIADALERIAQALESDIQ